MYSAINKTVYTTAAALAVVGGIGLLFSTAFLAQAATAPVITTTIQNGSNLTLTQAPIGTAVHALVTVSTTTSSTSPTGTVDFTLYGNTSCTGASNTAVGVSLVNGAAQSATTTLGSNGLSYKVHYNGDASTTPADGICKALVATAGSITLNTTLSTTTAVAGTFAHDSATLANATGNASGTVAYTVYNNNSCTTGAFTAGVKTVTNASVPNSNDVQFNVAGTYYWQAVYSGDTQNNAATSSCQSEVLTITATTTPPATGTGTISGNIFNDQNGNDVKNAGEPNLGGWTVWLHQGNTYDGSTIQTATTDSNGNYSFINLAFGTYFVEEQEQSGLTQTSDDTAVTLSSGNASATVNFANASSTAKGDKGKGHSKGGKHGEKDKFLNGHDNGKHWGQIKNGNEGKHKGQKSNGQNDN